MRSTLLGFLTWLIAAGCGREQDSGRLIWHSNSMNAPGAGGDVLREGSVAWIAYQDGASRIRITHVDSRPKAAPPLVVATLDGTTPSLIRAADGDLVLVHTVQSRMALRRGSTDGRTWSPPVWIAAPGAQVANDRLVVGADGAWLLPVARDSSRIELLSSHDSGTTWSESEVAQLAAAADPALTVSGLNMILVARSGDTLVRTTSLDAGRTWSPFAPIVRHVERSPHALSGGDESVWLAWTDPAPDSAIAPPPVRALRLAASHDGGDTWSRGEAVVWRAGSIPGAPALDTTTGRLAVLFSDRGVRSADLVCVERNPRALADDRTSTALRLWTAHTMARPKQSQRLFIEGYFMRGLVAAHVALKRVPAADAPLDGPSGLQLAVAFADWMLQGQTELGYWPLGYKAMYVADMAVAVALYADLAPYVAPAYAQRFVTSAAAFAAALERDGMLLPSGATGVGWLETRTPSDDTALRTAYLVSTSLAGVGVHAWLYARTQNPEYRARALRALDYTLAQIQPDGSLPGLAVGEQVEGPFLISAYVQEGWMAADTFLNDDDVHNSLRQALPAHVDWLVRTQGPDGLWDSGADGELARTPPIAAFLQWYQQRCTPHAGARAAVERAAATLTDPDRWLETGVLRAGKHEEVLRALTGRTLAALGRE